jgi:hypothetical protein
MKLVEKNKKMKNLKIKNSFKINISLLFSLLAVLI